MAKQIKGNKIIEDNHLDNAIKSGEEYLEVLKKINAQVVSNAKALKSLVATANPDSAKAIKEQTKALTESQKAKAASIKIDKDIIKAEQKLKILTSDKVQKLTQLNLLNQQQAKINKEMERNTLGLVGAYEKESKLLIKLRKELKDLIITEGEGSKKTKQLATEVNKLDAKLKKADAAAGQFQRNVGNYKSGLKGAISTVKRLGAAFGVFAGLQLAVRGIREMFNVVKNFDQSTADLAAVLGVTTDQMSDLTQQAMDLGAATIFTASQVSELQKEYAKLGFTQDEIKGVTEATLELAAATNSDLGTSATVVGSTLRAFGLDVSETQRVVDVMAKSFSASSLDMEKFTVAMRAVAPVAKNAGFNIEETTALLGTLTDAGIDASTAGTGLRNVFLELSKQGLTFEEAMSKINNASDKNAASLALFGKRGAVIGTVLAESGVSADALTDKLNNAGGAAKEMADKQLNTLGGAVKLLQSAWEGWILKMNESSGAGSALTNVIRFLAENLETILSLVFKIGTAFVAYKAAVKAATVSNNLFNKSVNVKKLGSWIGLITTAALVIWDIVDGLINAKDSNDLFNDTMDKANELLEVEKDKLKLVGQELLNVNTSQERRDELIKKINAEYGTTLENLEDEAEFAKQVALAYKDIVENLDKKIKLQVVEEDLLEATKEARRLRRELEDAQNDSFRSPFEDSIVDIVEDLKTQTGLIEILKAELISLQTTGKKVTEGKGGLKELGDRFNKTESDIKGTTEEIKDNREEIVKWRRDIEKLDSGLSSFETINQFQKDNFLVAPMQKATKAMQDEWKKRQEALKEFRDKSLAIIKDITNGIEKNIDKRIEARKTEVEASQTEIQRLQSLGTADANEAIKAERVRQAKQKLEIEELEKKKKNLLISVVALERASQLIGSGNGNPLLNAKLQVSDFLSSLPTFYEGTQGTVAQALGATGTRDGHTVRVHDNEHIISAKHSDELHAAGLTKNSDIVSSALAYQNNKINRKALAGRAISAFTDANIVNELKDVKNAINSIDLPTSHYNPDTGLETVRYKNKVINIDHKPSTFKI